MQKECINTSKAPSPIGPYSQAIKVKDFLFISGQLPIDPSTGEIVRGGAEAQTKQCMKNILAILTEASLHLNNLIKVTIYVKNLNDLNAVNKAYSDFFEKEYPARVCIEVARLPKDASVEIEAIAVMQK